jgi:hypothetical protein
MASIACLTIAMAEPKPPITIIEACQDPEIFGPWFKDQVTWAAWFAFLKVMFAETALLPAPFWCTYAWNRPTSTGADGSDPLWHCWRGKPWLAIRWRGYVASKWSQLGTTINLKSAAITHRDIALLIASRLELTEALDALERRPITSPSPQPEITHRRRYRAAARACLARCSQSGGLCPVRDRQLRESLLHSTATP